MAKTAKKFETLEEALAHIEEISKEQASLIEAKESSEQALKVAQDQNSINAETISELGEKLQEAESEVSELKAKLAALNSNSPKESDEIKKLKQELSASIAEKEAAVTEANSAIAQMAELGKKLDILEQNKGSENPIIELEGKYYKIIGNRFLVKGKELNAVDLSKNTEELKRMISIGSGSLVEVESK